MRRPILLILSCLFAAVAACGPSLRGDDDGDDDGTGDGGNTGCTGDCGYLTGRVWAPGNAPGMVPAGHEIPIFGALVYLTLNRPAPIPQQVYCESCLNRPGAVASDHDGNFNLGPIRPGAYWLVIEKGQFRLEQQITIEVGERALPQAMTTLPSELDPQSGKTIPRIAMVVGSYDSLEDILGKMGLGTVDPPVARGERIIGHRRDHGHRPRARAASAFTRRGRAASRSRPAGRRRGRGGPRPRRGRRRSRGCRWR